MKWVFTVYFDGNWIIKVVTAIMNWIWIWIWIVRRRIVLHSWWLTEFFDVLLQCMRHSSIVVAMQRLKVFSFLFYVDKRRVVRGIHKLATPTAKPTVRLPTISMLHHKIFDIWDPEVLCFVLSAVAIIPSYISHLNVSWNESIFVHKYIFISICLSI